jgi:hypothetical protein
VQKPPISNQRVVEPLGVLGVGAEVSATLRLTQLYDVMAGGYFGYGFRGFDSEGVARELALQPRAIQPREQGALVALKPVSVEYLPRTFI